MLPVTSMPTAGLLPAHEAYVTAMDRAAELSTDHDRRQGRVYRISGRWFISVA